MDGSIYRQQTERCAGKELHVCTKLAEHENIADVVWLVLFLLDIANNYTNKISAIYIAEK